MSEIKPRTAVIITDCGDDNARTRLEARTHALIPGLSGIVFCRVGSDVEAAGNLVDAIDALDETPGVVFVNVAPRSGEAKRWPNGAPFCRATVGNTQVFGTLTGHALDLLHRVTGEPNVFDVFEVPRVVPELDLSKALQAYLTETQFRSYEFLPRLAAALIAGKHLPSRSRDFRTLKRAETAAESFANTPRVWSVDCFGNCKTTLLPTDIEFKPERSYAVRVGGQPVRIAAYARLKDIPNGQAGLTIGSSGLGEQRFLELQVQGGSAAKLFGLAAGSPLNLFALRDEAAA